MWSWSHVFRSKATNWHAVIDSRNAWLVHRPPPATKDCLNLRSLMPYFPKLGYQLTCCGWLKDRTTCQSVQLAPSKSLLLKCSYASTTCRWFEEYMGNLSLNNFVWSMIHSCFAFVLVLCTPSTTIRKGLRKAWWWTGQVIDPIFLEVRLLTDKTWVMPWLTQVLSVGTSSVLLPSRRALNTTNNHPQTIA